MDGWSGVEEVAGGTYLCPLNTMGLVVYQRSDHIAPKPHCSAK